MATDRQRSLPPCKGNPDLECDCGPDNPCQWTPEPTPEEIQRAASAMRGVARAIRNMSGERDALRNRITEAEYALQGSKCTCWDHVCARCKYLEKYDLKRRP